LEDRPRDGEALAGRIGEEAEHSCRALPRPLEQVLPVEVAVAEHPERVEPMAGRLFGVCQRLHHDEVLRPDDSDRPALVLASDTVLDHLGVEVDVPSERKSTSTSQSSRRALKSQWGNVSSVSNPARSRESNASRARLGWT